jgi:hypothetical protein
MRYTAIAGDETLDVFCSRTFVFEPGNLIELGNISEGL